MPSDEREALALRVLKLAAGGDVEASIYDGAAGLTRFTQNAIHQNVASANTVVRVRVIAGGRTGVAEGNGLDDAALQATAARARALASFAPVDVDYPGLGSQRAIDAPPGACIEATAQASPERRAHIAAAAIATAERNGLWAAGYVTTGRTGVTIANSNGTLVSFDGTDCGVNVKQNGAQATGFAEQVSNDVGDLDGTRCGDVAAAKARASERPVAVEPGAWTVILEPPALGELLSYLGEHFSARAYSEGSSFLSAGLERTYAGETVGLADDVAHPLHAGMPFDYEGYSTQRVPLLEAGVARELVTDATWARRLARPNTGHGLPAPNAAGPQPRHLVLDAGVKPLERLIAETARGLLVTRFWYIRPVDRRKTIVTGMTRDGTFLIEDGRLTSGVHNLRFNQSILEALRNAEFSDRQVRTSGYSYSMVVPAAKFEGFRFTSRTDF
jgi:predicted Zn-dependent protease